MSDGFKKSIHVETGQCCAAYKTMSIPHRKTCENMWTKTENLF